MPRKQRIRDGRRSPHGPTPYYPSQQHTGQSTFGDDRARFGPAR